MTKVTDETLTALRRIPYLADVPAGRVKLVRHSRAGREQILHAGGPGATLGEAPAFDGGGYVATPRG